MLHVPTLKPDQEPFDINQYYPLHPFLNNNGHTLPLSKAPAATDFPPPAGGNTDGNPDPELILDHTLVKDAITTIHIEDDEQSQTLLAYSRSQICDIVPDYLRFVKAQKDKYGALLKTNRQRHLFATVARTYFDHARNHAHALRDARIRQFQIETIERQNKEFTARSLRPETIMDDHLQRQYRDMILHNIELLLADAPPEDRENALDAASRDLYQAIMDKRLSSDPKSLAPLIDSSAVRRVLPRDILAKYRTTMEQAILRDAFAVKARAWVEDEVTPGEAKRMASEHYADPETRAAVLALFTGMRTNFSRRRYLRTFLAAETVWKEIADGGYDPGVLPGLVRNGDTGLFACVLSLLAERERCGGGAHMPDYCFVLKFVEEFDPEKAAESLSRPENVYELIMKAGGLESPLYASVLRLFLGKLTVEDRNWFDCLLQTRDACTAENDGIFDAGRINRFVSTCDTMRRLRLQKNGAGAMDAVEMDGIITDCLKSGCFKGIKQTAV